MLTLVDLGGGTDLPPSLGFFWRYIFLGNFFFYKTNLKSYYFDALHIMANFQKVGLKKNSNFF